MKRIILTYFIISICTVISLAQCNLTIEIHNLKSNDGQILLSLLDENEEKVEGKYGKIENNKSVICFENLDKGNYAFKFFHDENDNNELDTNWMGIPKEGYGFSNNARVSFGAPTFDKLVFPLNDNKTMISLPKY